MRTISLVNRFKWTFPGNMNPHALVLGDVDNDGDNEFVIGNLNGELAIFKGECPKGLPAYVCRGLGTITCIAIGDVRNWGRNSIVAINAEGHAHIFDLPRQSSAENAMSPEDYLKHGRRASDASSLRTFRRTMSASQHPAADDGIHNKGPSDPRHTIQNLYKPNSTLKVPVNVNKLIIADFDGDGLNEIILARTDRILHAFLVSRTDSYFEVTSSMHMSSTSSPVTTPYQQANSPLLTPSSKLLGKRSSAIETKDKPFGLRKSMGWSKASSSSATKEQMDPKAGFIPDDNVQLIDKAVWVFDGQITSLSIAKHPEKPNEPILIVAQPGNTFTIIDSDGRRYNSDFTVQNSPQTQYGKIARRSPMPEPHLASGEDPAPSPSKADAEEEGELSATPKASDGALFNLKKATQSIRTFLQRGSSSKSSPMPAEMDAENVIISDEGKIQDTLGNEITRANYVVQNWPEVDGDDIIGEEESRAVATEIVIGKKLPALMDSTLNIEDEDDGPHVGMLSMDGKFTIYNLRTRESFQRDLFVTHKLFSLATLDISSAFYAQSRAASPLPQSQTIPHSPNESPKLRFPVAPAESNSSNNGNPSGAGSPSFSSSSKLSRVTTNASGQSRTQQSSLHQDMSGDNSAESTPTPTRDHLRQSGLLDVTDPLAKSFLEPDTEITSDDNTERISRADSIASSFDSKEEENVSWADMEDTDQEGPPTAELFVACAWNGVTYLIDWSQRVDHSQIKFQLVQFAFEGRVCAFTAGLYAISPGVNVPCLFYVDFEDQVFCYYDVRVSPGPVTGFIDVINDDVKEALERISSIDGEIRVLAGPDSNGEYLDSDTEEVMDLGDGWRGVADGGQDTTDANSLGAQPTDLASFIHECLYNFEDLKEQLQTQVNKLEDQRSKYRLPITADIRRFSDLNISVASSEEDRPQMSFASDEEESSTWMSDMAPSSPRHDESMNM